MMNLYRNLKQGFSMKTWLFIVMLIPHILFTQTLISGQDFESSPASPTMTFTNSNGAFISGNSGTGDRLASSPYFTSGSRGWERRNGTSTLTFMNNIGLGACTDKHFLFNLAAFSISSTGNGMDAADNVKVEISLDGGATWSSELRVIGNSNARWSYAGGTGNATTTYDGDNTPTDFKPSGGGTRTTDGYSNIRVDLPNSCTQAQIRITLLNNSSGERWAIDDVELHGTCVVSCDPDPQPTSNASGITVSPGCTSAQINFTGGNGANAIIVMSTTCPITSNPVDQVSYPSNSTFGSGSTIGTGNSVVYNGAAGTTIVSGLTAGTTYCFKIYEYNGAAANCQENYLTSSVLTTTFITASTCSDPQIRSILVNACTAVEGFDEMLLFTNGNSALDIDDITITYPSGGTFCNSGCTTKTLVNNASYVNSLNTLAGCTLFQYANPIPAGATVFVFTGQSPTMVFDYSAECPGGGPYYVIFSNNTTSSGGRFANNAGATRTLTIDFGTSSDAVTYTSNSSNTGSDGDYVSFENDGTASYGNIANCAVLLPVEWGYLNVETKGTSAWINWSTQSERMNDYFVVEYATEDGVVFKPLGTVKSQGLSSTTQHYSLKVSNLEEKLHYFKIKQVDLNGEYSFSDVTTASIQGNHLNPIQVEQQSSSITIKFNQKIQRNSQIYITDITGKKIFESELLVSDNVITIPKEIKGLILITINHINSDPHFFKLLLGTNMSY